MKILVTGGAGFIGSNIVDACVGAGHSVSVIDNLSSGRKENLNPMAGFFNVDITDSKKISDIFAKEKFDVVCHHAAQIDVRKSVADPVFDASVNVLGTLNLLEASKTNKVRKFIFASSGGTIYGECGDKAPDESFPANPLSPYGIAKHTVEFYLKYYSSLFGIKYTSLRYGNVYGPRQDPHGEAGVVAIFSNAMLDNKELYIFGDGNQMRDYVYVADVVRANIIALDKGDNEIINIGTGVLTSVNELYNEMAQLSGYKKKPVAMPARKGELFKSFLDSSKAKKVLGWQPQVSIKEGLAETLEYFEKLK